MDNKQLELIIMYQLCGVEPNGELFYEKGSTIPATGNKIAYDRTFFGMVKTKTKRAEMSFKNGKQHGPMKLWFKNGNKWLDMEYFEGKPHGLRKLWYENGEIEEEALFEYGELVKQKNTPNIQILQMFVKLYEKRLQELGVGSLTNKKDKKSIESFLLHEYDSTKEKLTYATGNEKMLYNKFLGMIDGHKNDIIDFINQNV